MDQEYIQKANRESKISIGINSILNRFFHHLKHPVFLLSLIAFFYDTLFFYIIWIFDKLPYINIISHYIIPTFILLAVLSLIQNGYLKRITAIDGIFLVFVCATIIMSMLIYPNTYDVVKTIYLPRLFSRCIPIFLLGLIFRSDDEMLDFIGNMAQISIVIGVIYIYYMLNFGNPEAINDDNMGLAYNYLTVEMFVLIHVFRRKHVLNVAIAIVGGLLIVSFGTRGPVVLMLSFVALCLLKSVFHDKKRRSLVIILTALVIILFSYNYQTIMVGLIDIIGKVGLSTRVLQKMLLSNVFEDLDRMNLRRIILEKISERPFMGYGVAGEWQFLNWNAHNMYLTFLSNFGVILGTMFLLLLSSRAIKAYIRCRNDNAKFIILMFACLVFVKGFFAGDAITEEVFFLIGYSTNLIRKNM